MQSRKNQEAIEIISLGGGLQSSAMLLMAERGEIEPRPEAAIFADTGWEAGWTYQYIEYLKEQTSIPIHIVTAGNLREDSLDLSKKHTDFIPAFTKTNTKRGIGKLKRQCTSHYKIRPIRRCIRKLFGKVKISQWIGISLDEIERMRESDVQYITLRYPLVEKRLSRYSCQEWLKRNGYDIPRRSACLGCPLRTDEEWQALKEHDPAGFENACDFDDKLREKHIHDHRMLSYPLFLYRKAIPLREAEFTHRNPDQLMLFEQEDCQGGCWL